MVFTEKAVPLPVIVWPVGSRCTKLCDPRWPAAPLGGRLLFKGKDSFKMSPPWVDCLVVGDPLLSAFPVAAIPRLFNHLSLFSYCVGLKISAIDLLRPIFPYNAETNVLRSQTGQFM